MLKLRYKVYKSHSVSLSFIEHFYFPLWWALGITDIYMSEFTIQQDRNYIHIYMDMDMDMDIYIYIYISIPEYKKQTMCTFLWAQEKHIPSTNM